MFHRSRTGCYHMAVGRLALQTRTKFRTWLFTMPNPSARRLWIPPITLGTKLTLHACKIIAHSHKYLDTFLPPILSYTFIQNKNMRSVQRQYIHRHSSCRSSLADRYTRIFCLVNCTYHRSGKARYRTDPDQSLQKKNQPFFHCIITR